ncbi:hypothetical protein B0G77_8755 [Paraburkholderia sp. BL10I2N1]|nr:hypothetical protein B0G77_8755 [Paraburkholderia sp. BL10I2N1]
MHPVIPTPPTFVAGVGRHVPPGRSARRHINGSDECTTSQPFLVGAVFLAPAVLAPLGNADFLTVQQGLPGASLVSDRANFSMNDAWYVYNTQTGLRSDHR